MPLVKSSMSDFCHPGIGATDTSMFGPGSQRQGPIIQLSPSLLAESKLRYPGRSSWSRTSLPIMRQPKALGLKRSGTSTRLRSTGYETTSAHWGVHESPGFAACFPHWLAHVRDVD